MPFITSENQTSQLFHKKGDRFRPRCVSLMLKMRLELSLFCFLHPCNNLISGGARRENDP